MGGRVGDVRGEPVLAGEGLRKSDGERLAVAGVGFTIAAGETYGLLGPNGAGRVTLQARELGTGTVEVKAPRSGTCPRRSRSTPT